MIDMSIVELEGQHVELLPARTTMATNALGGRAGNGGTSILGGIAIGILSSGDVNAEASDGGNGGDAANVFG